MQTEDSAMGSDAGLIWRDMPESKLELIDGRLVAGNTLAGSRYLLWAILQTLGPRAALPLAPLERWWDALGAAFHAPRLASPRAWETWAANSTHTPHIEPAGEHWSWAHHDTYGALMMGLYRALREDEGGGLGRSIQRFTLRLGDDAFLPDLQCFRRDRLHRLQTYYYDGPADLVIEVTLPGSTVEREVKRRRYAAGGVPEYWIVDPQNHQIDFLRLEAGSYLAHAPDDDGWYRSSALPGLVCHPARLWASLDDGRRGLRDTDAIAVEPAAAAIGPSTEQPGREGWSWAWQPFTPPVARRPVPIRFEQFLDWCPESKFELLDGKPYIGGWDGTRKTLGMLLLTFGLDEAVTLLHPRAWVTALLAEAADRQADGAQRDAWWGVARQSAALLRERFGARRVAVIGDLVRPEPLHYWSEITLVTWGMAPRTHDLYEALRELPDAARIDVLEAERASPRQETALGIQGVEV